MPRTILVHINVELAEDDLRTADEVADAIESTAKTEQPSAVCTLAEEV
jgi:hypothetical protein